MIIDVLACMCFCFLCIIMGLLFYLARTEIERPIRYVGSILLTMLVAMVASFLIMSHIKVTGFFDGFLFHAVIMVVFWCIYLFIYRAAFRMARFYDAERSDYSLKSYFKWRKYYIRHERMMNEKIDNDCTAMKVGVGILCTAMLIFVIVLFASYSDPPAISSDYALEDKVIQMSTVEIPKGTKLYSGLPATKSNLVWETTADIKLQDAVVRLATDKRDTARIYWIIDLNRLSTENRGRFKHLFTCDIIVLESWMVTVKRNGEIFVP